jgi:hypothetical protein
VVAEENQHRLYELLDRLDWHTVPVHAALDIGHGRRERRTIQVLPTPEHVRFLLAARKHFPSSATPPDQITGKTSAVA